MAIERKSVILKPGCGPALINLKFKFMALTDFFRINFPYGIQRNDDQNWTAFNREYQPLGFFTQNKIETNNLPLSVEYEGVTDKFLFSIAEGDDASVHKDKNGKIIRVFFYNDGTNPANKLDDKSIEKKNWEKYMNKVKKLSTLQVSRRNRL